MDPTLLFAAITAAVVLQAGILVALYLSVRQTSARMEALAADVRSKVLPTAEVVHSMLVALRPKIETIVDHCSESAVRVSAQIERLDATLNDVIDRTRLQVIRADELVNRTLDRVEQTTDMVHHTVVSPVQRLSGVLQGLTVGLEFLLAGKRRRREGVTVPQDEMFI